MEPFQLLMKGCDRKVSVIAGTPQQKSTEIVGIAESEKWRYSAINVAEDAIVHVSNLYNQTIDRRQPIGVMLVKSPRCTLSLTVKRAKIGNLLHGLNAAQGSVRIE